MNLNERLTDGSALVDLMKRLEDTRGLDPLIARLAPVVDRVLDTSGARPVLQGRGIGHAAHPLLTDFPLGLWTATNVLDLLPVPGSRRSAQRLLALGLASTPVVLATGWAEWSQAGTRDRRVGLLHAALNASGLVLYGLSLRSRRQGRHARGVALALGGSTATAAAGYLGGHLAMVRKVSSRHPGFEAPAQ
jgi:uncharacterized membrane protein